MALLAAWALRLHRLDYQDIWWDEARNIDVATRALADIAPAPELDIHPPLYFYGLHVWTAAAGVSAFSTRFFSVWFGMLVIALVYRLGRGLAPGREKARLGLLAMILAAFAPYALAEAQETRMYTLSWALLAAGMLALWRALQDPGGDVRNRLQRWGPFALLATAVLLTHYASAIILAAWGVWLLGWALFSRDRWSRLATLVGVAVVVGILCLPVLPIALRQIPGYDNPNLVLPDLGQYIVQLSRAFTLGEFVPERIWFAGKWAWLALVAVGALLALGAQTRQRVLGWRWALLMIWLFGGLAIFYGILVARSAFNARYISFVLPALWALAGWALWGWRRLWRPLPWLSLLILLALIAPSVRADLYDPAYFREDISGVVSYLKQHAGPEDIILVDQRYPFGLYWQRWNNDFDGFPPAEPADQTPAQYLFVDLTHNDERRVDRRLTALAGDARRIFWVTWFESDMDPRGAVKALLDANGDRIDTKDFRGFQVRAWEMTPPTHFQLAENYQSLGQTFGSGLALAAGDWSGRTTAVEPGSRAVVVLRWRALQPPARSLKVSLRLKDASGVTLDQDDRLLLSDRHLRTPAWAEGESALNIYSLKIPDRPGVYTLAVVVYDEETGEPVLASDSPSPEVSIGQLMVAPKS